MIVCPCPPDIIPVSFDLTEAELLSITEEPKSWQTLQTDVTEVIAVEAVHLEIVGFDFTTDSLGLYADPARQVSLAGAMRPLWVFRPDFNSTPAWFVPTAALTDGFRAECRLPVTMRARALRLWTSKRDGSLGVSGSVFYRPIAG